MKWFKAVLIAVPTFFGAASLTVLPTTIVTAMPYYTWKAFWLRLANALLDLAIEYVKLSMQRGYMKASVPSQPIIDVFQSSPVDAELSAQNGVAFRENSLFVSQDILLYVEDNVGVAIRQGEYPIDADGNFHFDLVRVDKPVPSPTFPLPRPTQL